MSSKAAELITALFEDPAKFQDQGRGYDLLQEYFGREPVESLGELLAHENPTVQRVAIWVASELGDQAGPLLDRAVELLDTGDRYIQYHALEILAVCAVGERVENYRHVLDFLTNGDDVLRGLAMRLVSNATTAQLKAAVRSTSGATQESSVHAAGIAKVLSANSIESEALAGMLESEDALLRRYGAIAARRELDRRPYLLEQVASSSDADLRKFAEHVAFVLGR